MSDGIVCAAPLISSDLPEFHNAQYNILDNQYTKKTKDIVTCWWGKKKEQPSEKPEAPKKPKTPEKLLVQQCSLSYRDTDALRWRGKESSSVHTMCLKKKDKEEEETEEKQPAPIPPSMDNCPQPYAVNCTECHHKLVGCPAPAGVACQNCHQ